MHRRLYFVLPDEAHARQVGQDLDGVGLDLNHIHAISGEGVKLAQLPPATPRHRHNIFGLIECIIRGLNLAIFFDMHPDY